MRRQQILSTIAIVVLLTLAACAPMGAPAAPTQPAPAAVEAPAAAAAPSATEPTSTQPGTQPAAPTQPPAPTPTREPLPPTVVNITPDRGEEQLIAAPVVVTFDQPMDPASTSSAFGIQPAVPGDVKVKGNQLTFTPTQRLERGLEYRVTVAASATSASGLRLLQPVAFKFKTVGFLEVTGAQPADGATDVAVDGAITVAFNRPVVPLVGVDEQAGLPQPLVITPTVSGAGEWINTSLYRFTPDPGLAASQTYTVTVPAGLEDTTGGVLAAPYAFSFRTSDPVVVGWSPENTTNFRIEKPISVTFSMAMDKPSTEAAFTLVEDGGAAVEGTFNWDAAGTVLGFKPTAALKMAARYTASVALTARAATGEGTLKDTKSRQFSFQTVPLPKVTRTVPQDGHKSYAPDSSVRFEFAGPMNPSSFVTGTVTILPKPTRVYTYYNEYENHLYLDFAKEPATAYTVTLSGKVADLYGNTLGQDVVLHFRTGDLDTVLYLNEQNQISTYNAYTATQAVVTYRNLPEVRFDLYRVTIEELISVAGGDYWSAWNNYRPKADARIRQWTRTATAPRNTVGFMREPLLDGAGEALQPGVYWLELGAALPKNQSAPRQLLVRTDLNVTLKVSDDQALAWVTDLKTGQPVAGATVRFNDNMLEDRTATTDADGIAAVELTSKRNSWNPLLAIATTASGGFGVASTSWQDGISPWDFNVMGVSEAPQYVGYVYTDRPIYRPGQTVHWKGIIRRDNDASYTLPTAGQPVTVVINDDQGNMVSQQELTLNALGAVDGALELGPDATLGYYYISLRMDEETNFGVGFQVAEYRKPEYELAAQSDKPEYIQGEQINVTVQANYFFGGPVKNAKAKWVLLTGDASFNYTGEGYWSFEDWSWWDIVQASPFGGQLSQGEGRTDDQGRFTFSVPADIARFKGSQRFTFDITIEDVNNQSVSTQAVAIVHKGEFYIGLSPRSYVQTVGGTSEVDLITVDPQSKPAPGVTVTAVVNQVEWKSVREQAEDGNFYWVTRPKYTPVVTKTLTTDAQGAALLTWTPAEPGEYKIVANARDKAGHQISSAAYVWVSGRDFVPWRQENNDRIKLVADKNEYKVGDTAEILIPSPYQGKVKALVTVERGRIISRQVIELTGNSQLLKLPIVAGYAPNVYASVVIIKGMDETNPAPSFKMGLVQLEVSAADKVVQVVLTPRKGGTSAEGSPLQFAPRDTVVWDVQTLDAAGKPISADVSLALVDKAVLTLASDSAGKLVDRFYSRRGLGVVTSLTLALNADRLVAQLAAEGKGGGGGGDGPGISEVRRDFPDIALWRASLTTDASGKASVEVTLPDNLTTWVMDARAATADTRVGQAQAEIVATKDLLVRPVLPRFFVAGDRAEIAGVVHNTTAAPITVRISLTATGLDLALPALTTETVSVPAGGTYKAAWPVAVQAETAEVVVQMRAESTGGVTPPLRDAVEITLPVYRYSTPEVVGTSGQVAAEADVLELVRLPAGIDTTRAELDVTLEPSLAAGMLGGLTYLEHYPYECVEQTMSRFLPNVVSYMALKKLGQSNPELEARLPQQVGVGLQRIYNQQHVDGGWGWWQRDESSVAVSSYVVFGLAKARQAGFAVDENVLARGVKYLQRNLKAPKELHDWQLDQQAFIVYALAEAGQPEPNRAGALFAENARLANFGKVYLALALELIDDDAAPARIKTLVADLSGAAVVTATSAHWEEGQVDYWNMNTDTRSTALAILAIAKLDPENSLGPNAVRWLMAARKADRWETTQENAWAIISLTEWMAATGELQGDYTWSVALNGEAFGEGTVTPATVGDVTTLRADIARLLLDQTNGLVLSRSAGPGQLYYTAHLKTYMPVPDIAPRSRGLTVSREYRLADCLAAQKQAGAKDPEAACPPVSSARVGDVLSVKVTLIAPHSSYYVVTEDPLPAGLEPVDTSLRITSQTAEGPGVEATGGSVRPYWWWNPTHVELRDEKAVLFATYLAPGTYEFTYQARASLPGVFLTLPANAYQMYFPEVWGRGAGSVFTVTE